MDCFRQAVCGFFSLHPEYAKLPFYVFGDSYAGTNAVCLELTLKVTETSSVIVAQASMGRGSLPLYSTTLRTNYARRHWICVE